MDGRKTAGLQLRHSVMPWSERSRQQKINHLRKQMALFLDIEDRRYRREIVRHIVSVQQLRHPEDDLEQLNEYVAYLFKAGLWIKGLIATLCAMVLWGLYLGLLLFVYGVLVGGSLILCLYILSLCL